MEVSVSEMDVRHLDYLVGHIFRPLPPRGRIDNSCGGRGEMGVITGSFFFSFVDAIEELCVVYVVLDGTGRLG